MSPATRPRHFPRESLIARLGEASMVTGGSRRATGRNYLDDAQRATQSKGDSRGAGVEPRGGCGVDTDSLRTRARCGHSRHGHGLTTDAAGDAAPTWPRTGCGHGRGADVDCFRTGRGSGLDKATASSRLAYDTEIPRPSPDHFADAESFAGEGVRLVRVKAF